MSCSLFSSPVAPPGQPVPPPQQTHTVHGGQDLWRKAERSSQAPSSGHVVHAVTPPSTQPLLLGSLFEETGEVAQVSYENRKWLSEGCYPIREGSCVLSLVSGQQRRPWDDGTNGSTWASCKSRGIRGSTRRVPHHRGTVQTEYPGPGAKNLGPSKENSHLCDRGRSQLPPTQSLELPCWALLQANPGAHGP